MDVSAQECFDSKPNLMMWFPARSSERGISIKLRNRQTCTPLLTVGAVTVGPNRSEPSTIESITGTQATGAQNPVLTLLEQWILQQRVRLVLAHHELETHKVSIAAFA